MTLPAAIWRLQDFQARAQAVFPDAASDPAAAWFSASDLAVYQQAWAVASAAAAPKLSSQDAAAVAAGGPEDPFTAPLGQGVAGLGVVIDALAGASWVPWALGFGLVAIVGVMISVAVSRRPS
jgi:hypothetical protein